MRIIAGQFRGFPLVAPGGTTARPTTDRVRESLMSTLMSIRGDFDGAVVLDAFAGSGALGLEALSRGAERVVFYERDAAVFRTLIKNCKKCEERSESAQSIITRKADILKKPPHLVSAPFDLVFLDPPYSYDVQDVLGLVKHLSEQGLLIAEALVIYEHDTTCNLEAQCATLLAELQLNPVAHKKYGETVIDILQKNMAI